MQAADLEVFVQDSQSMSVKGVLRGLHFQKEYPQGKLVRVIKGVVYDVAVDLRADSQTYGKDFGVELSAENHKQFYSPEGLAWNDPEINIQWPQVQGDYQGTASADGYCMEEGTRLNLSEKDQKWEGLGKTFKF